MTCCGAKPVWIDNGPRLQYWYCKSCKNEVTEKKEPEKSPRDDEYPFWGLTSTPTIPNPANSTHHNWAPNGQGIVHCNLCRDTWDNQVVKGFTPCEGAQLKTSNYHEAHHYVFRTDSLGNKAPVCTHCKVTKGEADAMGLTVCFRSTTGRAPSQPTVSLSAPGVQRRRPCPTEVTVQQILAGGLYEEGETYEMWLKREPQR